MTSYNEFEIAELENVFRSCYQDFSSFFGTEIGALFISIAYSLCENAQSC